MFLADHLWVYAFDGVRLLWQSRRLSLDGISNLTYSNGIVRGIARDVEIESVPFSINADTGESEGGFTDFDFQPTDD